MALIGKRAINSAAYIAHGRSLDVSLPSESSGLDIRSFGVPSDDTSAAEYEVPLPECGGRASAEPSTKDPATYIGKHPDHRRTWSCHAMTLAPRIKVQAAEYRP